MNAMANRTKIFLTKFMSPKSRHSSPNLITDKKKHREKRFGRAKFAETVEKEDLDHAKRGGGAF